MKKQHKIKESQISYTVIVKDFDSGNNFECEIRGYDNASDLFDSVRIMYQNRNCRYVAAMWLTELLDIVKARKNDKHYIALRTESHWF